MYVSHLQWGARKSGTNEWVFYVMRLSDVPQTVGLFEWLIQRRITKMTPRRLDVVSGAVLRSRREPLLPRPNHF